MAKKNVLICDDEEGVRESLNLILSEEYNLFFANNAQEALEHLKNHKDTHLVFMDIKMPKMDGLTALEEIKKIDPDIRVLIVTGYKSTETANKAVNAGACGYIVKPFTREEILKTVRETLA